MKRSDFFSSMEQTVTLKQIIGKDTANAQAVFKEFNQALVSTSGASLPPASETIPEGSIRVFLRAVPSDLRVGDLIALSKTRVDTEFVYSITAIDDTVRGANARRYRVRIEAKRRAS